MLGEVSWVVRRLTSGLVAPVEPTFASTGLRFRSALALEKRSAIILPTGRVALSVSGPTRSGRGHTREGVMWSEASSDEELLTKREVARLCRVHVRTVD